MTYKKLVNFYVFVLSILAVNLISDKITTLILGLRLSEHPMKATLIGMGVLVFVLYPAYHYIERWSEKTAVKIFNVGRNAAGKFIGVTLAFLFCLFVLFIFYLQEWYSWKVVWEEMVLLFQQLRN